MSALGFTGTRQFTRFDLNLITSTMWSWFDAYDTFVTGACIGFDAAIGSELVTRFPNKEHVVYVPFDRSRVDPWWERRRITAEVDAIEMPEGTNYRDRNIAIVMRSQALFYAGNRPENHPSQKRSGTWMTVRLARKSHILTAGIVLHPLVP